MSKIKKDLLSVKKVIEDLRMESGLHKFVEPLSKRDIYVQENRVKAKLFNGMMFAITVSDSMLFSFNDIISNINRSVQSSIEKSEFLEKIHNFVNCATEKGIPCQGSNFEELYITKLLFDQFHIRYPNVIFNLELREIILPSHNFTRIRFDDFWIGRKKKVKLKSESDKIFIRGDDQLILDGLIDGSLVLSLENILLSRMFDTRDTNDELVSLVYKCFRLNNYNLDYLKQETFVKRLKETFNEDPKFVAASSVLFDFRITEGNYNGRLAKYKDTFYYYSAPSKQLIRAKEEELLKKLIKKDLAKYKKKEKRK